MDFPDGFVVGFPLADKAGSLLTWHPYRHINFQLRLHQISNKLHVVHTTYSLSYFYDSAVTIVFLICLSVHGTIREYLRSCGPSLGVWSKKACGRVPRAFTFMLMDFQAHIIRSTYIYQLSSGDKVSGVPPLPLEHTVHTTSNAILEFRTNNKH